MQWATAFNANHSLDGPIDACWPGITNIVYKSALFSCPELTVIAVTNGSQMNIERLKLSSSNTFYISELFK